MIGSAPFPVVTKALNGFLQGGVFVKELVHPYNSKYRPEVWTHARKFQISVKTS